MNLVLRIILGSISLGAVWFATWQMEAGSLEPMVLAVVFSVAVSACASWLALKTNKRSKVAPVAFAAPFLVFSLICLPALIDGTYRPFLFWILCASAALILSAFGDALVFRKIIKNEKPNKPVQTTAMTPPPSTTTQAPLSDL